MEYTEHEDTFRFNSKSHLSVPALTFDSEFSIILSDWLSGVDGCEMLSNRDGEKRQNYSTSCHLHLSVRSLIVNAKRQALMITQIHMHLCIYLCYVACRAAAAQMTVYLVKGEHL